ncbi:Mur ligase [Mycena epipterygia]|nr:Mur ligase [Mycena epipterygia]
MSIDLTLDRIQRLARHLPTYTRPTCHIAGTNGKGSVSALVSSMLSSSTPSLSVGRFNSPHLISVNDCIVINNESVSSEVYQAARVEVEQADKEHAIGVSSFEILTLTALLIFERAQLDVVVLEVGMGGRLDATNIIADECVLVSALTAVDLDHQAFLGNSVAAIAAEKAAIARKGVPFILGDQTHSEVEAIVASVVNAAEAELLYTLPVLTRPWDTVIDGPTPPPFSLSAMPFVPPTPLPVRFSMPCFEHPVFALLPLHGEHQLDNLGLAVSVVSAVLMNPAWTATRARFTNASIAQGIRSVKWPGRLSFHTLDSPPLLVLADGAHNAASAKTLAAYLSYLATLHSHERPLSLTYIIGLSHSPPKTPRETLAPLLPFSAPGVDVDINVALLSFTPPDGMPWVKAVPPAELQEIVKSLAPEAETWIDRTETSGGLQRALDWAAERQGHKEGLVVLAGSLYLVADFYRLTT